MKELPDIVALQAFVAVAEASSFDGGARRIGLTRSAAGKAVARLEALLGARLLHRTTRRVGLTAEGQSFKDKAAQILNDLENAQSDVSSRKGTPRGVLRVTAPEAYGRQIILPILGEYLERWPEVSAEADFTDRIVDIVEDGYDVAVRFVGTDVSSELISRVISRSVAQLCASPSYLARHPAPSTVKELASHRHIVSGTRDRPRPWVLRKGMGAAADFLPKPVLLTDNAAAMRDAAMAGQGITYLPRFVMEPEINQGRLERVLPDYASPEFPISVLYPTRRHLSPKVRLFIDLLEERLAD